MPLNLCRLTECMQHSMCNIYTRTYICTDTKLIHIFNVCMCTYVYIYINTSTRTYNTRKQHLYTEYIHLPLSLSRIIPGVPHSFSRKIADNYIRRGNLGRWNVYVCVCVCVCLYYAYVCVYACVCVHVYLYVYYIYM